MSFFGSLYFKSKPPWNWQQQALHMFFPHHFGRDISSSQPLLKMKRCFRVVSGRVQGWPLCYCMWFEDDSSIYSIYIYTYMFVADMVNSCNLSRGSMSLLFWFLQLVFVAGSKLPTLHSSSLASLKLTDISLKIGLPYKDNWSSHHHFSLTTSGKPLPRHRWCSINYWIGVRRCTGQIWQKYRIVFGRLVSLVPPFW